MQFAIFFVGLNPLPSDCRGGGIVELFGYLGLATFMRTDNSDYQAGARFYFNAFQFNFDIIKDRFTVYAYSFFNFFCKVSLDLIHFLYKLRDNVKCVFVIR